MVKFKEEEKGWFGWESSFYLFITESILAFEWKSAVSRHQTKNVALSKGSLAL